MREEKGEDDDEEEEGEEEGGVSAMTTLEQAQSRCPLLPLVLKWRNDWFHMESTSAGLTRPSSSPLCWARLQSVGILS